MKHLENLAKNLQASQKAVEVLTQQKNALETSLKESIAELSGEDQFKMMKLQAGISNAMKKASRGDMSFQADLRNLKQELSGGNSNR